MIKIALIQPDIIWEDPEANKKSCAGMFRDLKDAVDVILLPELFTTGFTMRTRELSEPMGGPTMEWMAEQSDRFQCHLAGSIIIEEEGRYYNRLIWMKPGNVCEYYDKRHLFRMSGEHEHYGQGNRTMIIDVKGFRVKPLVCYDLRFPVWSRNRQDYDILVYLANWPAPRRDVWLTLLKARALENQAYLIGVNRVGRDGMDIQYRGDTMALNAKGQTIASLGTDKVGALTVSLSLDELVTFREKFPVWKDADSFTMG